jgi:hypothetical protein
MLVLTLVVWAAVPAVISMLTGRGYLSFGRLLLGKLHPGVPIVYRMIESSTRPVVFIQPGTGIFTVT